MTRKQSAFEDQIIRIARVGLESINTFVVADLSGCGDGPDRAFVTADLACASDVGLGNGQVVTQPLPYPIARSNRIVLPRHDGHAQPATAM